MNRWIASCGVGLLALAAAGGLVAMSGKPTEERVAAPISSADQARYEDELVAFLAGDPEPRSVDFGQSVAERNAYWKERAAWWDRVPWEAVAGQWGCVAGSSGASMNPPDRTGLITAGYGGTLDCGGRYDAATVPTLTEPIPRSSVERPGLDT